MKDLKMQIEIIAVIFDWFSKKQVNLPLLESDWYSENFGLTILPGHRLKVMLDMNLVLK